MKDYSDKKFIMPLDLSEITRPFIYLEILC